MATQSLLVATHNAGKVREFAHLLADLDVEWLTLDDAGVTIDVAETGSTFYENAVLKAKTYAKETGLLTFADDSGLEVDALNGRPGVQTARYGGASLTHEQRYHRLLQELSATPWDRRTARFQCVIVLARPDGALLGYSEGTCEGIIAEEPAGAGGFGYDPVFYLPEQKKTMAQVETAVKNKISHRSRALHKIAPLLRSILADD